MRESEERINEARCLQQQLWASITACLPALVLGIGGGNTFFRLTEGGESIYALMFYWSIVSSAVYISYFLLLPFTRIFLSHDGKRVISSHGPLSFLFKRSHIGFLTENIVVFSSFPIFVSIGEVPAMKADPSSFLNSVVGKSSPRSRATSWFMLFVLFGPPIAAMAYVAAVPAT